MNIDYKLLAEQKAHLVAVIRDLETAGGDESLDQSDALTGILHLLDALGDEADPTVGQVQSDTLLVRFRPEAWVNDYAVEVDAGGPQTWHPSVEAEGMVTEALDYDGNLDFLKDDPFAPKWVRDYSGPFEIEVVED